jgi:hypothetical protein
LFVLTPVAIKSFEAFAEPCSVITYTSSRAVPASFITKTPVRICSRLTFLESAGRSAVAQVTNATHYLHAIPWNFIDTVHTFCEEHFRPAKAVMVAVLRTNLSLACHTFISGKAFAFSCVSVAFTFIGALDTRGQVVGANDGTNPSRFCWASPERTIDTSPLWVAVDVVEADTVAIIFTDAMA